MEPAIEKTTILALLQSARHDEALQRARQYFATHAHDPEAHYLMGLACLLKCDYAASLKHLGKAAKLAPDDAVIQANLGIARLRGGDVKSAITALKHALALQPDYTLARYNLGCALIEADQAQAAIDCFQMLHQQHPDNAEYLCALADAVRETGQWRKAISLYRQVLEKDPRHGRAHTNMGPLMMHLGRLEEAVEHCRQAIAIAPDETLARKNLGDCLVQMERLDDAMDAYADAWEIQPDDAELCTAIGKVWLETADWREAASWFQKALDIDADHIGAQCGLAGIEREQGLLDAARERLEPLYERQRDNSDILLTLADIYWDDGDAEGALHVLQRLLALQPQRTALYAKIGNIHASAGDVNKAVEHYRQALAQQPNCIPALHGLATALKEKLPDEHAASLTALLQKPQLKAGALASVHNALAFYHDGRGEYETAARHMAEANRLQWAHKSIRGWAYDCDAFEQHIAWLMEHYNRDYFDALAKQTASLAADNDAPPEEAIRPVFIVGMPRSGTTLCEQILARHPRVLGIGERQFATQSFHFHADSMTGARPPGPEQRRQVAAQWRRQLDALRRQAGKPEARYIVDKLPDNYSLIGWILTLFPEAILIHMRRDPRDVALSCWLTQFGAIRWACHEAHIVHRIAQYRRIMQHWRQVLPGRLIEMDYEKLVREQEGESRRLLAAMGLDWHDDCLRFYESDRLVRTASITQVRQPAHTRSTARWRHYEAAIPALFRPLTKL